MESPSYHPRANGLAERAVRTVKYVLKTIRATQQGAQLLPILQKLLLHHRCMANSRGKSPAEIVSEGNYDSLWYPTLKWDRK